VSHNNLRKAKDRIKKMNKADRPETLVKTDNPDDAEQKVTKPGKGRITLVKKDSPDDYYVHKPETLGIKPKK
jgi:hypothetical protein